MKEYVTTDELKEILGWEEGDEPLSDRIETHSGYWLKHENDFYEFVWEIDDEDR